jgi:ribose transport system substrate-binding protein
MAVAAMMLIALLAAACGGASSGSTSSNAKKKVVYIPGLTGNPFYTTVGCGAQSVAGKLNVAFSVQGAAQFDVAQQTSVLNAVVASKPDAIMISITDPPE